MLAIGAATDAAKLAGMIKNLKAAGNDAELITLPGGQPELTPAEMEKLWPQIFKWLKKRKITS